VGFVEEGEDVRELGLLRGLGLVGGGLGVEWRGVRRL
jgi:hypothetical protein